MDKIRKAILPALLFAVCIIYGQGGNYKTFIDFNNIELPKSPGAANLGKYGDIPVNSATGIPSINVPIYTLEVDGLIIPISLSYHASGVQVNELATAVGLKWTLNAGGGIFRSVVGKPDEHGWLSSDGPISDSYYQTFNIMSSTDQYELTGGPNGQGGFARNRDHNPDDYSYNFLGFSGKYITDFGEYIIKNQADNLFVDPSVLGSVQYPAVTDQEGNEYFFSGHNETSEKSFITGSHKTGGQQDDANGYSYPSSTTGWMLSTVKTKNNKSISFDYEPYFIADNEYHIISNTIASGVDCAFQGIAYAEMTSTNVFNSKLTTQHIKKISSENIDILFDYSLDAGLSIWKKKLTKITINDKLSGTSKEFYFEYNKFEGDKRLMLKRVFEKKGIEDLPGYYFDYIPGDLPPNYSMAQDFFGYNNGMWSNTSLVPKDLNIKDGHFSNHPGFYDNNTGDRSHSSSHLQIGALEIIKYPTGGSTKFFYEPNAAFDSISNKIKYCGGLRVKRIEDWDNSQNVVKNTIYTYEGLVGQSLETNIDKIKTIEYSDTRAITKNIFHSSFTGDQEGIINGYFYRKVTTIVTKDGISQKKENNYIEKFGFGTLSHLLSSEKIFTGNNISKVVDYQYDWFGINKSVRWNILGHYMCIYNSSNERFRGYDKGRNIQYDGNTVLLPVVVATTDFLKQGSSTEPVTMVQFIDYDDKTLLKNMELSSTRYKRESNGSLTESNPNGEELTTHYTYPWSPGVDLDFLPPALLIGKEVYSSEYANGKIFGQFFEYDAVGNIKKTYQYDNGAVGNTSAPSYVPVDYEEMTNFLFSNGKPVQVWSKSGEATSYIWGYNAQFPVAKIEGKTRAALDQNILHAVENAGYGGLPTALNTLRSSLINDKAMLTTYTYKPLAGVEKITDPKGDYITYHYDEFGRLEYVEDKEGKILSENEYKYAH